ncbi:unnamed protein product [Lymnaea stagnalis]|uniref:Uncharacterized protein n=1 Tax=Lymnaea stagnalis TaxID=6523 RepID=A0AAV2HVW1_LYMST
MADLEIVFVFLSAILGSALCEYCTKRKFYFYSSFDYQYQTIYCPFGCCGPFSDEYCCIGNAGYIVGIVVAAIAGIAMLVAVICCCIKKSGAKGRVVHPTIVGGVPAVTTQYTQSTGFVGPSAPPSYSSVAYTSYGGMYPQPAMPPPYPYPPGPGVAPLNPAYDQTGQHQAFAKQTGAFETPTYSSPASNGFN